MRKSSVKAGELLHVLDQVIHRHVKRGSSLSCLDHLLHFLRREVQKGLDQISVDEIAGLSHPSLVRKGSPPENETKEEHEEKKKNERK